VRVRVRTADAQPQEVAEELTIRYQPPPPRLTSPQTRQQLVVHKQDFDLHALLYPGKSRQAVKVRLSHTRGNQTVRQEARLHVFDSVKPLALDDRFRLQPGYNLVELIATNQEALAGYEELETTRLALE